MHKYTQVHTNKNFGCIYKVYIVSEEKNTGRGLGGGHRKREEVSTLLRFLVLREESFHLLFFFGLLIQCLASQPVRQKGSTKISNHCSIMVFPPSPPYPHSPFIFPCGYLIARPKIKYVTVHSKAICIFISLLSKQRY